MALHLNVIADELIKTGVETEELDSERTLEMRKPKLLPTCRDPPALKTDGHSASESFLRSRTLFGGLTFSTLVSSDGESESAL